MIEPSSGSGQLPDSGEAIWAEAQALVNGPKAEAYGDPGAFFGRLASATGNSPEQECARMIVFKATRLARRYTHNDHVDLLGYIVALGDLFARQPGGLL